MRNSASIRIMPWRRAGSYHHLIPVSRMSNSPRQQLLEEDIYFNCFSCIAIAFQFPLNVDKSGMVGILNMFFFLSKVSHRPRGLWISVVAWIGLILRRHRQELCWSYTLYFSLFLILWSVICTSNYIKEIPIL